jgi:hypothetical protein
MEFLDRRLQLRQAFARRFDQEQSFPRGLDLPFPTINGGYSPGKSVGARGETSIHDSARNPPSFGSARTGHKYNKFIGHNSHPQRLKPFF